MTGKDTIFALSSGALPAGIAVVRSSGPASGALVAGLAGRVPGPRLAELATLRDPETGEEIDRGLVLFFPGPASVTGEDVAEFHLHGGRAVVARLLSVLGSFAGCRMAEAGEFTRRAFDNGKLDLTEAEGLADLIDSETEGQRKQALRQMSGALRLRAEGWRAGVLEAMALIAADLDFADEDDVGERAAVGVRAVIEAVLGDVEAALSSSRIGKRIRDGVRVVIAGAPNVGKSSLLNRLAGRDVAIVSKIAGTTRDAIEVRLDIGGVPVDLVDTAGIREAGDEIEAEGIRRSKARMDDADLVVHVIDATAEREASAAIDVGGGPVLVVRNKIDLAEAGPGAGEGMGVSAETGEGLDEMIEALGRFVAETYGLREGGVVTRERQRRLVADLAVALRAALGRLDDMPELAAEELRRAAHAIGGLTGTIDVEEMLGSIFGRFCIGK